MLGLMKRNLVSGLGEAHGYLHPYSLSTLQLKG